VQQLLREGVAVGIAFTIEARPRVAVPVPGAAHPGAGLEHPHPQPELAQTVELVEAGDARADDDGVVVQIRRHSGLGLGFVRGCHRLRLLHPVWSRTYKADGMAALPVGRVTISRFSKTTRGHGGILPYAVAAPSTGRAMPET